MLQANTLLVASAALLTTLTSAEPLRKPSIFFRDLPQVEQRGIHNIHIDYMGDVDGELTIAYGSCDTINIADVHHRVGSTHVGRHPIAARHVDWEAQRPTKFAWTTPADVQSGCLFAFLDQKLVGISSEIETKKRRVRRQSRKAFADVADPMGPWFDGVAYLEQKQPDDVFVAAAKNKRFGILGAGISGLATGVSRAPKSACRLRRILEAPGELLTDNHPANVRLCGHSQLEDPRILIQARRENDDGLPQQHESRRRTVSRNGPHAFPLRDHRPRHQRNLPHPRLEDGLPARGSVERDERR